MILSGKVVNLPKLEQELTVANIVHQGLGVTDDDLHTYDENGVPAELPPEAQAVVDAHVILSAKEAKVAQIEDLSNQYLQTFQSSALGTPHTYLSALKDIALLDGEFGYVNSQVYGGEPINWYTIEQGYVDHTAQQFIQVWLDGRNNLRTVKEKAAGLIAQVQAATTIDEVNAIQVVFP